ncbi:MAG TPA: LamG-like jellyroll fold domain-containing protein [Candidatus Saccharimonadales bacterium]|nr:LamG-like jellyroll fold domain-containing protein [Candidatus Saccharimonadales bacterium]
MPRQLVITNRGLAIDRSAPDARRTPLHRLAIDGDFWPSDLVAFWDFSETSAPFYAKKYTGTTAYPLENFGTTNVTKIPYGPFGSSIIFNGTSRYLKLSSADIGDLNVAQFGDQVTVVAWYEPFAYLAAGLIAGVWEETSGAGKRQYALFHDLPLYGGNDRVCGHVSYDGGVTPGYPYNKDYSASARPLQTGTMKFIGMVYDGTSARSYTDGITDVKASNNTNPYPYNLGLNRVTSPADFTIGAVKAGSSFGNFINGALGGVAVFRRALTESEMMDIHIATKGPDNPIIKFDFFNHASTTDVAATIGWKSALGATASDTSSTTATNFGVANISGNHFLYKTNTSPTSQCIGYFSSISGLTANQISEIKFRLNNSKQADKVRLLVQIGDAWYATHDTFSVTGDGRSAADWSNAELKSFPFTLEGSKWRDVNFSLGTSLGIDSSIRANNIPDGELKSIGFHMESVTETVRIDNLSIY